MFTTKGKNIKQLVVDATSQYLIHPHIPYFKAISQQIRGKTKKYIMQSVICLKLFRCEKAVKMILLLLLKHSSFKVK